MQMKGPDIGAASKQEIRIDDQIDSLGWGRFHYIANLAFVRMSLDTLVSHAYVDKHSHPSSKHSSLEL